MRTPIFDLLTTMLQKGCPILLNFADDALLLMLSKLGISFPWLQWVSLILLGITLIVWSLRIARFFSRRCQVN